MKASYYNQKLKIPSKGLFPSLFFEYIFGLGDMIEFGVLNWGHDYFEVHTDLNEVAIFGLVSYLNRNS